MEQPLININKARGRRLSRRCIPISLSTGRDCARTSRFRYPRALTGWFLAGTTGESPTLDWDEHNKAVSEVVDERERLSRPDPNETVARAKPCPVLAGAGSNSTSEAVKSTRNAAGSGAEAVLMVDCYYNGPSSQELRDEDYAVVAEEFPDITIVPYVIPGRSGTALSVEDMAILASRFRNINAVKESTGDFVRLTRTRGLLGPDFSIMSGDDDITCLMTIDPGIRADGVISVTSNVAPAAVRKMTHAAASGDTRTAREMGEILAPLFAVVTVKVDNERTLASGERVMVNDRYRNPLPDKDSDGRPGNARRAVQEAARNDVEARSRCHQIGGARGLAAQPGSARADCSCSTNSTSLQESRMMASGTRWRSEERSWVLTLGSSTTCHPELDSGSGFATRCASRVQHDKLLPRALT